MSASPVGGAAPAVVATSVAPGAPRTLSGTLAKTPMPRLLVSASTARVTGTLEISCERESAIIVFSRGMVTKIRTSAPVAYLGSILYEQGLLDDHALNDSLAEVARTKRLHGEVLKARRAIGDRQLVEALHEQTTRKLVHLFQLPGTTAYRFDSDVDGLEKYGGADWPHVDPIAAVWRGVRDGFADEDVSAAMAKVAAATFRLSTGAMTKRYDFSPEEQSAVECLRSAPLTLEGIAIAAPLDAKRAKQLAYFLLVTKSAEIVDAAGVGRSMPPRSVPPRTTNSVPIANAAPSLPLDQRPTTKMPAVQTDSAKWRAVGPIVDPHSGRISIAPPTESGQMPAVVPRRTASSPTITMGGVAPVSSSEPASVDLVPVNELPVPPASGTRAPSDPPVRSGPMRAAAPISVPPGSSPSSGNMRAAAPVPSAPDAAARKQRIAERARTILKEDHFQRLSLARDATGEQLDAAFIALRTLWDPALLPPGFDEVRDDCAFVLACLAEAHGVLRNPITRAEYMAQLRAVPLRSTADQVAEDLAASGARDAWAGAQACFARGEHDRAERLARRATKDMPETAGPLALLAWIEAQKPSNQSAADTRPRIAMLDRAIRFDPLHEQAHWWRGQLHKRIENHQAAIRDFRRVVEINPKHMDAIRELRIYEMRIRRNSITMKAVR
jgi:hypothetical protein